MDDSQEFQEYQEYEEVCEEAGTPEEAAKDHSTDPGTVSEEVRKKANKYFFSKVAINALLMILGAVLIALFLTQMQRSTALYKQEISSKESLTEVIDVLESHSKNAEELITVFHDCNQDKADDLRELFTSGVFDSLAEADKNERTEVFRDVVERSGVDYNNSEISGALNMTQATSFAMCQITIEYGQDIEYVEEVLKIFYKNGITVPYPHVTVMRGREE